MHAKLDVLARTVGLLALASCSDPTKGFDGTPHPPEEEEICPSSADWLPNTPGLPMYKPLPHPAGECPFYRGGWQNFLIATQPIDDRGTPAIRLYPTVDDVFQSKKPHGPNRAWLGDIKQAGQRRILIDQNGNTLYYGIHVNQAFVDFVKKSKIDTLEGLRGASPDLFFPAGVVEFKSAWQKVDDNDAEAIKDYVSVRATVPHLKKVNGLVTEDKNNAHEVTLRLLALHVVFTLPGHPEFIWATFEHSDGTPDKEAADGHRNVAPTGGVNPVDSDPENLKDETVVCDHEHLLCKAGTKANQGNHFIREEDLNLDEATQSFPGQETSIYRMFPAAKSNTIEPDAAIRSLNHNVEQLFLMTKLPDNDKRGHYRLVGAQWMDKPEMMGLNRPLQNDLTSPFANMKTDDGKTFLEEIRENGSDSPFSILAGEDRLSSTAMESFTQGPGSFPNCFSCHNTQAVTSNGIPVDRDDGGRMLLAPKLLNVSHVLSQFVLEETE
jgi:hypothetical protein